MQTTATLPILLKELKLSIFYKLWTETAQAASEEGWSYEKYLAILSEQEVHERYRKRITRHLKMSGLRRDKVLSGFDFSANKTINKQKINALAKSTAWVTDGNNLLIFGPSGVGKSHLAMAIGHGLIEQGIRVLYRSAVTMVQDLLLAKKNLV